MASCPADTIKAQACLNGLMQAGRDKVLYRALLMQILCNGGTGGGGGTGGATVGSGSPAGVVTANPGAFYWDTTNKQLWIKDTGTDANGWFNLI